MNKRILFLTMFMAAMFIGSRAYAKNQIEMSFQSLYGPSQTQNTQILIPWAQSFTEKSSGDLMMNFFPGSAIVDINEVQHAIKNGLLDSGVWAGNSFPKDTPYAYMVSLPFLAENCMHATSLSYALYEQVPEFKANIDQAGEMLSMWSSATLGLTSINRPIRSPDDLIGKRVLIAGSQDSAIIEAWGGIPVLVAPGDIYVGLQRGMGEVLYAGIPFQRGLRIMEVGKYITPVPATVVTMTLSVNKELFDSMTDEQKQLLRDASGRELGEQIAASFDSDVGHVLQLFRDAGAEVITLSTEESVAFHKAAESTLEGFWVGNLKNIGIKGDIQEWIDRFYAISKSVLE